MCKSLFKVSHKRTSMMLGIDLWFGQSHGMLVQEFLTPFSPRLLTLDGLILAAPA